MYNIESTGNEDVGILPGVEAASNVTVEFSKAHLVLNSKLDVDVPVVIEVVVVTLVAVVILGVLSVAISRVVLFKDGNLGRNYLELKSKVSNTY